ncbi:N-acetyltransferase family 8 member 3-like [Ambystoma mexicanum]|uniref:N-acetyltransferase family 8 member 3-like n=1 Tax=Ambystoma mexicanum TaxID=8296 RepID=UPI0037E9BB64
MAAYRIRTYKEEDHKTVCEVLALGIREHISPLFKYALKLPRARLFLLTVPFALFVAFESLLLSTSSVVLFLAFVWYGSSQVLNSYLYRYLHEDISDIEHSYLQKKGACFWVAKSNGEVAGFVAADLKGEKKMELKRMYVSKKHRVQGIGKALCQVVINFAREQGCEAVVLETSIVQYAGQKLYERMGFKRTYSYVSPIFFSKLLHFVMMGYTYDIPNTV